MPVLPTLSQPIHQLSTLWSHRTHYNCQATNRRLHHKLSNYLETTGTLTETMRSQHLQNTVKDQESPHNAILGDSSFGILTVILPFLDHSVGGFHFNVNTPTLQVWDSDTGAIGSHSEQVQQSLQMGVNIGLQWLYSKSRTWCGIFLITGILRTVQPGNGQPILLLVFWCRLWSDIWPQYAFHQF